jgi:hypothetical protein
MLWYSTETVMALHRARRSEEGRNAGTARPLQRKREAPPAGQGAFRLVVAR